MFCGHTAFDRQKQSSHICLVYFIFEQGRIREGLSYFTDPFLDFGNIIQPFYVTAPFFRSNFSGSRVPLPSALPAIKTAENNLEHGTGLRCLGRSECISANFSI